VLVLERLYEFGFHIQKRTPSRIRVFAKFWSKFVICDAGDPIYMRAILQIQSQTLVFELLQI
jgi:hypothetical protein